MFNRCSFIFPILGRTQTHSHVSMTDVTEYRKVCALDSELWPWRGRGTNTPLAQSYANVALEEAASLIQRRVFQAESVSNVNCLKLHQIT